MKPYLTHLFRVCAVISSLLVDAVESGEVEICADELGSVYDVRSPMDISSDENSEGISPVLVSNVFEGEDGPRPEF